MKWLGPQDFRPMPWANGKGTTLELARQDRDGAVLWRLSRAQVVENGPFSLFSGLDRVLTVLTGPGFGLKGDGVDLKALPYEPVRFSGDIAVQATGVTAPCDDFNVMVARGRMRADVRVAQAGARLDPGGALLAVYWPQNPRLLLTEQVFENDAPALAVWLRDLSGPPKTDPKLWL